MISNINKIISNISINFSRKEGFIMEYHISKSGNDKDNGTKEYPFQTISRAAEIAEEGDRIIVHKGIYRECISPKNGARSAFNRIIYEAAKNEKVVIKGSEEIKSWKQMDSKIWKAEIINETFGQYNPYAEIIDGDWLVKPIDKPLHTGQVYINNKALAEVSSIEFLTNMTWTAIVKDKVTEIYADFGSENPNNALTEINVRESCFCPDKTGINYISVCGFEFAHAATRWAPPTAEQIGMVSAHWSKGWIIENNIMHDSRCSAISIGKEISTGHNMYNRYHRKPGCQTQLETVFAGKRIGWSKETIGSHIIRNNTIFDCGQNAIVGHMGGAFSEIYNNHIYNIGNKHEFFGFEIAGIKLHAAIDTYIHHNCIHDCLLGTWLDWQAQGTRLSSNIYYNNETDLWIEVTHGPHLVDNNIFGSKESFRNAAQGGAYIHNLFCGSISRYDTLNRPTPYHYPHSTDIMGTVVVYGGDDRFYNNIFIGNTDSCNNCDKQYGTEHYNGYPTSMEEYIDRVTQNGKGDIETFISVRQPAYINNNVYLNGAKHFDKEKSFYSTEYNCNANILEQNGTVYLDIDIPNNTFLENKNIINTHSLPVPRISEMPYESPDEKNITLDKDIKGSRRENNPKAGPLEELKTGKQKIILYTFNTHQ